MHGLLIDRYGLGLQAAFALFFELIRCDPLLAVARHIETTHGNLTTGELDAFVDNDWCSFFCHNVPGVLFGLHRYPRGVFESFSGSLRANYTGRCGSRANYTGRCGSRANYTGRCGSRANYTGGLLPEER